MKLKKILFIPLFIGLTSLTGCNNTTNKVELKYGQMIDNSITSIDYQSLKEKFLMKETFMVSVHAQGCACWSTFSSILRQYIEENHVKIYEISYDNLRNGAGATNDVFGLNIASGTVSFAIVENGEFKYNEISKKNNNIFKSYEQFKKFMDETVSLPKMFYISLNQVDELFKDEETSLLYFARSNCSDCNFIQSNVLENYNFNNNMYILDCELLDIRQYDDNGNLTSESALLWQEFKDNYYMSSKNNPTYGYDTGYVPTLLLLKGNKDTGKPTILSGSVYLNDEIGKNEQGRYYIKNSYYTEERLPSLSYINDSIDHKVLKGLEIGSDGVIEYQGNYYWDKEYAKQYHDPLIKAFLDDSINKVTHTSFNKE